MVENLTKPTTGRLILWVVLALLWFLFLVQALAMQSIEETNNAGAIFWAVVQGGLVWLAWKTRRRKRGRADVGTPASR